MSAVEELEATLAGVAERTGQSVIGLGRGWSVGSGFVLAPGRVLTNAHNLRGDEVGVSFADGRQERGSVLSADAELDLVVIEVETGDVPAIDWDPELLGQVRTGRYVVALANPGGRGLRVTPGFVSSVSRKLRGSRGRAIAGAIEHTAALPRGSSGGPLVDSDGRLLGINTMRIDGGLILAIPADAPVHERVQALARGERPQRVRLGVAVAPPRAARRLRRAVGLPERDGVLIRAVEQDSRAERAGLRRGDLIVTTAGQPIDSIDSLFAALDAKQPGEEIELTIVRGADEQSVVVGA